MAELDIAPVVVSEMIIRKGDDKDHVFVVKTAAGVDVNVGSGYTAQLQARNGGAGGSLVIMLSETYGLTMGNGIITMSLLAAQTALLNAGVNADGTPVELDFELEITKVGSPDQVKTIASGVMVIQNKIVGTIPVTGVTLNHPTLALEVGGSDGSLSAVIAPDWATDQTLTWASSDTNVATVSNGTVTPVGAGTCNITATAGTVTATCAVTVDFVEVESVTVSEETLALVVGGATGDLDATVLPVNASDPDVAWTSSDELVATVDTDGVVTAVAAGTATITATAGEQTDTCAVTVTAE